MPTFYATPLQFPLYWKDEQSGELPRAVQNYFNSLLGHGHVSAGELKLLCEYCIYFIDAPCWENNLAGNADMLAELKELRIRARDLASAESIHRWNEECMELGLDPF